MQPLRKDHVDHYKDFVRDEFSLASNNIEREIHQQALDKVEEVGDQFAGVIHKTMPTLIKDMAKKVKALRDFQDKKLSMEHDLRVEAQQVADKISEHYNNTKKRNNWDLNNIHVDICDDKDPVEYVQKRVKKACHEEAEIQARKKHKLYHALENKKKKCLNILYTGSHIQPTLVELQKEMATANIPLELPNSLLALPSK